jgi:hypothetical protein
LEVALIVALLLSPIWLPLGFVKLPRSWLRFIPAAITPDWGVFNRNPNAFPIRLDTVCLIQNNKSVGVIRFKNESELGTRFATTFWLNIRGMELMGMPDAFAAGQIETGGSPTLPVGPWIFNYDTASENMIWLSRPNSALDVAAFARDDLPEWLELVLESCDAHEW